MNVEWNYLLVYSEEFMEYDEVKYFLNAREDVSQWIHVFDNVFIFVSKSAASTLGSSLLTYARKNRAPKEPTGRYFLTEIPSDRQGLLPKAAWNMLGTKRQTIEASPVASSLDDEIPF